MLFLEKYKDIFGKPEEGVHAYRFGNVAIIDYIFSIIFSCLLSLLFSIPIDLCRIGSIIRIVYALFI